MAEETYKKQTDDLKKIGEKIDKSRLTDEQKGQLQEVVRGNVEATDMDTNRRFIKGSMQALEREWEYFENRYYRLEKELQK